MGCVRTWLHVGPTLTLNPCPHSEWGTFNALPGETVYFFAKDRAGTPNWQPRKWNIDEEKGMTGPSLALFTSDFSKFSAHLFILLWVIFKNTRQYLICSLSRAFYLKTPNLNTYRLISVIRRCTLISSPHRCAIDHRMKLARLWLPLAAARRGLTLIKGRDVVTRRR